MSKLHGEILTLPKMRGSVSNPKSLIGNIGAKTINIGEKGDDGATFIPSVSADGVISWTNDKELPNPEPVNIKGGKGDKGDPGENGKDGADGKSAYAYAVDGGYDGTEAEFAAKMAAEVPKVDATLTQAGQAADAKAVGDKLGSLSEEIGNVADEVDAIAALSECGIITPAYQDGTFYTDADGAVYVL